LSQRAAIVGGGIIGLATALALRAHGWSVTVIDPDDMSAAASWGNAGHIATEQVEPLASWAMLRSLPRRAFNTGGAVSLPLLAAKSWLPFGVRLMRAANRADHSRSAIASLLSHAMPAWRALSTSLGRDSLLREQGHFVLWESEASARKGRDAWQQADIGATQFREITRDERADFGKLLKRPPAGGICFDGTGHIADPIRLRTSLLTELRTRECEFVIDTARAIRTHGAHSTIETAGSQIVAADIVIVAAGVHSASLLATLGVRVPMIAERGYHIQSAAHGWPDLPPVVFEDRSLIVTRFDSALRAASFLEFTRPHAPPDSRKWQRLREHVTGLGIPLQGTTQEWVGSRPTLPDYLPAIGRLSDRPNICYAFGHNHLGLTLGPLTGQLVAQLLTNNAPSVDLTPFRLDRFA
jgi:glycine/D-amino acid oxidase-like deaminating enzyme